MTLKQYIEEISPVNTTEKVDKLLIFIKTSKLFFDEQADYEIRLAIRKLSVQRYYADNKPDYDLQPSQKDVNKAKKAQHKKKHLSDEPKKQKGNGKREKKVTTTEGQHVSGRYHVPDWTLRKLVKNGRDYSYRHPTIDGAVRNAANRTKEQQEDFDWKNKPHIIYTPMGGQNKKY